MHLLIGLALGVAVLQTGTDPLLSRLAGQWTGTGTVLNQPSKIQMSWSWELGGRFMRLTFRNEMGTAPKVNVFEGHAYYRPTTDGHYRGMWFDNAGLLRPLDAIRDGDALVSKWGAPDTEEGPRHRLHVGSLPWRFEHR